MGIWVGPSRPFSPQGFLCWREEGIEEVLYLLGHTLSSGTEPAEGMSGLGPAKGLPRRSLLSWVKSRKPSQAFGELFWGRAGMGAGTEGSPPPPLA